MCVELLSAVENTPERRFAENAPRKRLLIQQHATGEREERLPHPPVEAVIMPIAVDVQSTKYGVQLVEKRFSQRPGSSRCAGVWIAHLEVPRPVGRDQPLM